jgi:hypothetical protein|tara:strand:+ start:67 stop:222 length:156 start_codon:yes stop_codon:yes gene_type:complete
MKKILIALAFLGLAACQAEVGERYTTIDDEKRETITKVVQKKLKTISQMRI